MEIIKGVPRPWFTADWHFFDRSLVEHGKRPFTSVEEMNECLIARHNEVMRKGDLVYCLGDLYMKCNVEQAMAVQKRLKGNFYVIQGNHDKIALKMAKKGAFVWLRQLENIMVGRPWLQQKQMIVLCHYAMRTWRNSVHNSYQLYGHSHGGLTDIPHMLQMDVGVDCHNFYPVSIEQVITKMEQKMTARLEYVKKLEEDIPLL